jgi:hypothetical protein
MGEPILSHQAPNLTDCHPKLFGGLFRSRKHWHLSSPQRLDRALVFGRLPGQLGSELGGLRFDGAAHDQTERL